MRTTSIKFTGLASGLDTESIVQSMIAPYKLKVDSAKQNQTMMEWRKEAWRDMNSKLFNFHDKYMGKLRLESNFNKKNITSSNTSAIDIDTSSTLPEGTHKIDGIKQLAEGARVETSRIEASGVKITKKTTMKDLGITFTQKVDVDGKPVVNDKSEPVYEPIVLKVSDSKDGKGNPIIKEVEVTSDMNISQLESKLKSQLSNSSISFDEGAGAFFIASKKTGVSQNITITSDNTEILGKFGIGVTKSGQNAIVSYNGIQIESESNNISVNGFKFTIKSTFNLDASGEINKAGEGITILSTQDTDAMVDFVKEFVGEYNKLIEEINGKLDATSAKGYAPLTDDQKKDMSDYEIEQWEKKIKDSLFRRDPDLKGILDEMRGILSGSVEGNPFKTLSAIGINTGNWQEKGKLHIDEDKLRAALDKDSDAVAQLFAGNGTDEKTKGIGDRLYDTMNKRIKSSELNSAQSFYNDKLLDKKIKSEKEEVTKLQKRMYAMEDMYYKKFTAMEKMMSQLNNQTNSLMSMLG